MVHKAASSEVLLTDAVRIAPGRFRLAVERPRGHVLYHPVPAGRSDPSFFMEALRQAAIYLTHEFYGIPLDHPFVFDGIELDVRAPDGAGSTSGLLVLDVTVSEGRPRSASRTVLSLHGRITDGTVVYAEGGVSWKTLAPRLYRRLRTPSSRTPERVRHVVGRPLHPARVGRTRPADVLLSEDLTMASMFSDTRLWWLRVDTSHPVFFDHPSDHVPGVLLLEAFRQASRAAAGPGTWAMARTVTDFASYCELDAPVAIRTRRVIDGQPGGHVRFDVSAVQDGRVAAAGHVVWASAPPPAAAGRVALRASGAR
ncbi:MULTISPECIES: ScbA/BarX family gamma-butyrolactone biosynthesis protein [unclassified Streptomyces]|uniref:ScbA/BarX family gamma-butyrolactone biosynthesis protein n=1 Tax=unclassified Streptomyces TaxID=2593676 RepID=UPI0036FB7DD2